MWGNTLNIAILQKIEEQKEEINQQKEEINQLKSKMNLLLWWNFVGYYTITKEITEIEIPSTAREVYLFAGQPNDTQVYGGRSYIIPTNNSSKQIVIEYELKNNNGTVIAKNFYAQYYNNKILARITEQGSGSCLLRVYYR